jgi:membrane protein DedA with SNARE-associated domain
MTHPFSFFLINFLVALLIVALVLFVIYLFEMYIRPMDQKLKGIIIFATCIILLIYVLTGGNLRFW